MRPETEVLILAGIGNSGPDHWQSHWERQDPLCERLLQREWDAPHCSEWVAKLDDALSQRSLPIVLAAHSSACALVAHWAAQSASNHLAVVKGALLVGPSDPHNPNYPVGPTGFGPVPLHRLPFRTIVVASTDDRYVQLSRAREFADAWGSEFVPLQNAGHINTESGYGKWPEGFALLKTLRAS